MWAIEPQIIMANSPRMDSIVVAVIYDTLDSEICAHDMAFHDMTSPW